MILEYSQGYLWLTHNFHTERFVPKTCPLVRQSTLFLPCLGDDPLPATNSRCTCLQHARRRIQLRYKYRLGHAYRRGCHWARLGHVRATIHFRVSFPILSVTLTGPGLLIEVGSRNVSQYTWYQRRFLRPQPSANSHGSLPRTEHPSLVPTIPTHVPNPPLRRLRSTRFPFVIPQNSPHSALWWCSSRS